MIEVSPELLAFLREEYDRCRDDVLEDERTTAIERYNGEPYGDEEDGRSQVVARDTAEVVDYMVISILRTIVSGDDVVEFVHRNADLAHIATQTIKHLFMDEQDGYQVLHDWLKAGLLEKNAVAMTYPEPRPPKRRVLEGISDMELAQMQGQGAKVIEAELVSETPEGAVLNVTVVEEQPHKFCDSAIASEEFYCSPDARTITDAMIKGRRTRKPIFELVAEGIDASELEGLASDAYADTTLSIARDEDRNIEADSRTGNSRQVWWHEEFARFDENGDGVAELLYIRRTADFKIFEINELEDDDDHPFEDWCPFPMQHRRIGQSLADKVMDIERVRTVLLRQSLDGIYLSNNPSTYVHEDSIGENTVEDLLTVRAGRLVRWKGNVAPVERSGNFDPSAGFNMLEFMNRERETRTGITRLNLGLDEDTINQTARGQNQLMAKGEQIEEYLARNFANAVARLFTKKAKMLKRFGQPITVPIDGQFVEVDPREWPEDMLARPRIGLGSSRKEQRMSYMRELIGMQAEAVAAGLPIVTPKHLFASAKAFVNDADLGDVSEYFQNPEELPPEQPKPDPEEVKAQAQMQIEQAKMQAKAQADAASHQIEVVKAQAKQQLAEGEAQARLAVEQTKAQQAAALAQAKAQFEATLAQQKMHFEQRMAEQKMAIDAQLQAARAAGDHEAKMSKNRPGGDLSK